VRQAALASAAVKSLLKLVLAVVAFLLVCCLAAAFRMHRVHDQTGEWRLRPEAAPPTLRIDGHLYDRTQRASSRLPWLNGDADEMDLGGGLLLLPAAGGSSSEIQVRYHDRYYDYRQVA
jgi:hypothetical protein